MKVTGGTANFVALPSWEKLGTTVVEPNGVSTPVNYPGGTTIFQIRPRSGACYFDIGAVVADGTGVYVPQDLAEIWGPLVNLSRAEAINLYADAGVYVHFAFFREVHPE